MLTLLRLVSVVIIVSSFAETKAVGYNCEVIKNVTYFEIINEKLFVTDSVIIQINNRSGENYSNISLDYHKDNPITGIDAWIEDRHGLIVRRIKNKDISDVNAVSASFYSDDFTKKFSLKHNEYPYRICYTYKQTFRQFFSIGDWCPVFRFDVPTRFAKLVFIHPESYQVNIKQKNLDQPEILSQSGIVKMTWFTDYNGEIDDEVFCPSPVLFLPQVSIEPLYFIYNVPGKNESWFTFGEWQNRMIEGLDVLPESEKQAVITQILDIEDKKEIVRRLYHYLQDNTRYIDVFIGFGGLKPYPATYVSQHHYGDCKALTVYMKALLKFAGIESYYTLIYASEQPREIFDDYPSQQFNHVILAVPLDNDTLWLENTSNCIPFGYTGTFLQNRNALLINDSSTLVKIPAMQSHDVMVTRKMEYEVAYNGVANVRSSFILRGREFETFNTLISNASMEDQHKYVREFLPFPDFEINEWKIIKPERDQRSLRMQSVVTINQLAKKIGSEYYFSFQPVRIPDFESVANRKLPVQIPYPICIADTLIYHLPKGATMQNIPLPDSFTSKYGKYHLELTYSDETLTILRNVILNPGEIPTDEYKVFYEFLSKIKTAEKQKVLFN